MKTSIVKIVFRISLICVLGGFISRLSFGSQGHKFSLTEGNLEYDLSCQYERMEDNSLFAKKDESTPGVLATVEIEGKQLVKERYRFKAKFKKLSPIPQEKESECEEKKIVTVKILQSGTAVLIKEFFSKDFISNSGTEWAVIKTDWLDIDKQSNYQCQIFWHGDVDVRFYDLSLKAFERKSFSDLLEEAERQHAQSVSDCLECLGLSCIRMYNRLADGIGHLRQGFRNQKLHER